MARWYLIIAEAAFILALGVICVFLFRRHTPDGAVQAEIKLPDASEQVYLQRQPDGNLAYLVRHSDGNLETFNTNQMAEKLYTAGKSSGGWFGLSFSVVALWLGIGFLGQVLFTGRMVVQWLVSQKKGKSIVPPMFWWMSLIGSLLLLAYFLWRRDPIGLLGQAFGSFIYLKNILWIRNEAKMPALATTEGS